MYPQFPNVLRAIRQSVMCDIMPDLGSDYAREQATGLLLLIEHLLDRWDRALDALREENADLSATLRAIAASGGGSDAAGEVVDGDPAGSGRGEELIAANQKLRARLAAVMARAPEGSEALRLARDFAVRQLDREKTAVTVGAITWE